jgi:hypothetical protein
MAGAWLFIFLCRKAASVSLSVSLAVSDSAALFGGGGVFSDGWKNADFALPVLDNLGPELTDLLL